MEIDVEKYLKDLDSFVKNHNESLHVKREYRNTLISVVGVCFGVLVAFKDETASLISNVFYFAGLFCCAASLVLLVIGAQGPIVAHKNRHEELARKIKENLFGNPLQIQNKRNVKAYNNCEIAGCYFFYVAIVSFCVYSFLALFFN